MNQLKYPIPWFRSRRERLIRSLRYGLMFLNTWNQFMCHCLALVYNEGYITKSDLRFAKKYIRRMIHPQMSLRMKLKNQGFDYEIEDCIKVYEEWIKRLESHDEVQ